MTKLIITPYNDMGEKVLRGELRISADTTLEALAERISYAINRQGLGVIRHVEVYTQTGKLESAWDVRKDKLVQVDGEGSSADFENCIYNNVWRDNMSDEQTAAIGETQTAAAVSAEDKKAAAEAARAAKKVEKEAAAAKRAEEQAAKKAEREAAKAAKPAKEKKERGPTKKGWVLDAMRSGGVTIADIVANFGISDIAARSLISDVKRMGIVVTMNKGEDKVARFTAPAAEPVAESAEAGDASTATADEGQAATA